MAQIKIDNTSFNTDAFKNVSKEDFIAMYKGRVSFDLNNAWALIEKELPTEKVNELKSETTDNEQNRYSTKKPKKV